MRLGHEHALARGASGIDRWLGPAVGLAAALLVAAWFLPLMTVQQLWIVFHREVAVELCEPPNGVGILAPGRVGHRCLFGVVIENLRQTGGGKLFDE